ncbi:hypothetical protein CLU79DRAFT_523533 [Phycomyces nitens]|nr:hypothetical protein CLU79DRAFT_523533 [Phycomyces nitens]
MRRKNRRRDNEAYENDLSSYGSPYQNQTNNLSQRGSMSNILAVGAGAGAATGSNSGTLPRHLVAPLQGKNDTGGYAPYPSSGEGGGATDGYYEDISPPYPPNNPGMSGYHPGGYYQDPSGVPMNHSVEAFGPPSYGQFRQVPNEVGYASSEERHVPHLIQNDVPHSRD